VRALNPTRAGERTTRSCSLRLAFLRTGILCPGHSHHETKVETQDSHTLRYHHCWMNKTRAHVCTVSEQCIVRGKSGLLLVASMNDMLTTAVLAIFSKVVKTAWRQRLLRSINDSCRIA
jgi:hypothetical protein